MRLILRGGSWRDGVLRTCSAARDQIGPDARDDDIGFRAARDVTTGRDYCMTSARICAALIRIIDNYLHAGAVPLTIK